MIICYQHPSSICTSNYVISTPICFCSFNNKFIQLRVCLKVFATLIPINHYLYMFVIISLSYLIFCNDTTVNKEYIYSKQLPKLELVVCNKKYWPLKLQQKCIVIKLLYVCISSQSCFEDLLHLE